MKKQITKALILESVQTLKATEFEKFLEDNKVRYHILDADNILDYNEGFFNVEISKGSYQESFLFIDGEYAN